MERFSDIQMTDTGGFQGLEHGRFRFSARFDLFCIHEAWRRGVSFEDLADGFGAGLGTMGGDWSGIRDSSTGAIVQMFQRALNALFPGAR